MMIFLKIVYVVKNSEISVKSWNIIWFSNHAITSIIIIQIYALFVLSNSNSRDLYVYKHLKDTDQNCHGKITPHLRIELSMDPWITNPMLSLLNLSEIHILCYVTIGAPSALRYGNHLSYYFYIFSILTGLLTCNKKCMYNFFYELNNIDVCFSQGEAWKVILIKIVFI